MPETSAAKPQPEAIPLNIYDNLYRLTSETIASDPNGINGAVN
jgi:hypothetical protein